MSAIGSVQSNYAYVSGVSNGKQEPLRLAKPSLDYPEPPPPLDLDGPPVTYKHDTEANQFENSEATKPYLWNDSLLGRANKVE